MYKNKKPTPEVLEKQLRESYMMPWLADTVADLISQLAASLAAKEAAEMERDSLYNQLADRSRADNFRDQRNAARRERDAAVAAKEAAEKERDEWKERYRKEATLRLKSVAEQDDLRTTFQDASIESSHLKARVERLEHERDRALGAIGSCPLPSTNVKPKAAVYSHPECVFNYCPNPEICQPGCHHRR